MKVNSSKLFSIYLAIVSFVSVIAIAINLGIVLTSVGKYLLITNDEYLQNREHYKLEQCEKGIWVEEERDYAKKTKEEIEDCKAEVKENVSKSRAYNLKDMFISSGAWFIVFLLLFIFHYPKFLQAKKDS